MIRKYSIAQERTIKRICAPLVDCLEIPVFTYCFVEADGRFGYISNALEFNEYYFSEKLFLQNPYFSNPSLFSSGWAYCPCPVDNEVQQVLQKRFEADHLFFSLQTNQSMMECFIFADKNIDGAGAGQYLPQLNLLHQFSRYFKREAKDLIGRMRADQFNIQMERGEALFNTPVEAPLMKKDAKVCKFSRLVTGLSRQELRCLELYQKGHSAQATAAIMGLSQRTVEHYFENIKDKLGCTSKYDLLNF